MKTKISAVIIDPLKREHDYTQIRSNYLHEDKDETFDLKVYKDTNNIIENLDFNRGFDVLITIGENINFEPLNNLSFEFRKKMGSFGRV